METQKKYKILLVDDDSFLIDMYSLKFTQMGHLIQTAQNAEDALIQLSDSAYTPDAILVDLIMPKVNGFELLEKIQAQNLQKDAALVILSNQGEQKDFDRGKELGVVGHIIKANAIPSEVVTMVETIIKDFNK